MVLFFHTCLDRFYVIFCDRERLRCLICDRESSTAATNNGADGRKIGDILLTNMTVLQVSHLKCK